MSALIHAGVFVGGQGSRMGGVAKGLLPISPAGPTLLSRLQREFALGCPGATLTLVGARDEYAGLGLAILPDAKLDVGPIGGLHALLLDAQERGAQAVLALACDLPQVNASLLHRLITEQPSASALAPKPDGRWQPLFARYAVTPALIAVQALITGGQYAMFRVLEALDAVELQLSTAECLELEDWDTPTDVRRGQLKR
jgi:molybdopterin-guanine dinucleotide biosynthesis protein A